MVQEKGINDMYRGWTTENKLNKKIYDTWTGMITRVYSEKWHEKYPTYLNSTLQLELHWLSYFAEHIKEIDGYNEEKFLNGEIELDKDKKSNGLNKEYSLENCMFISHDENMKQAMSTRNYDNMFDERNPSRNRDMGGKNNPNTGSLIVQYKNKELINVKYQFEYVNDGFKASTICHCCKGKQKETKDNYTFKYINDVSKDELLNYIIKYKQIKLNQM